MQSKKEKGRYLIQPVEDWVGWGHGTDSTVWPPVVTDFIQRLGRGKFQYFGNFFELIGSEFSLRGEGKLSIVCPRADNHNVHLAVNTGGNKNFVLAKFFGDLVKCQACEGGVECLD